ncbi:MAG: ABC transporter ATP-binding protein/permease [Oscillospiraceae bacterium]|nr:ABC transporter ATP-binding protein/permease [Oscillospiraceae bacterium]
MNEPDKWFFDPEQPNVAPGYITKELEERGIRTDDLVLFFRTDMDTNAVRCDNFIAVTATVLHSFAGEVVSEKGFSSFALQNHATIRLDGIKEFKVDELLTTARLLAVGKDESSILVANLTFGSKSVTYCAMKYLNQLLKDGKIKPAADKKVNEQDKFCPKCGNRYADEVRKACPKCIDRKKILARTFFFAKKYKRHLFVLLGAMVLTGLMSIIAPYVSTRFFYEEVLTEGGDFYRNVMLVLAIIISVRVFGVIVQITENLITAHVAPAIVYDLKKVIFSSIQRLSVSFFSSRQTGGLMQQVSSDAETLRWFLCDFIGNAFVSIIQVVAVLVIMTIFNPMLTLIALLVFPIALIAIKLSFAKMDKLHKRRWSRQRSMNSTLSDVLNGLRVVKAFAREESENERYAKRSRDMAQAGKSVILFSSLAFPAIEFLISIARILILGVGGWMIITGSFNMTFGILIAFLAFADLVFGPIFMFVDMIYNVSDSMTAMNRLIEVMDAVSDVPETTDPVELGEFRGEVEFRSVDFAYIEHRKVLKDVSFKIEPGKVIGIVGKTGAGKSTIANLILRLYDTTEGEILIDGHNVKNISSEDLHRNIAIVSQETYLFVGTILDNIRYANADASYEQVLEAAKMAGAHDFIMKMPEAYQTMIGSGYKDLSGGERQRVSIARALLRDPKILLLDEATAAMDTETERNIQAALERLYAGRTTIMIAHRLSTLRDADTLIVVDNGKVTESGTHAELLAAKGTYHKLYTLQLDALKSIGVGDGLPVAGGGGGRGRGRGG